jgi:protocatechuate 3,4-dioxygenase beta subunit
MDELAIALELGIPVTVEVLGQRGQPLAGAAVRLVAAGGRDAPADAEAIFEGILAGTGVTDVTGRLELGSFSPGDYELHAQRGSERSGPEPVTLAEHGGPVRLTVRLH